MDTIDYNKLANAIVDAIAARLAGKSTGAAKATGPAMLYTVEAEGRGGTGTGPSGKPWQRWDFMLADMQGKRTEAGTFSESAASLCMSVCNRGDRIKTVLESRVGNNGKTYYSFHDAELVDAKPAPVDPPTGDAPHTGEEPPF